MPGRTTAPPAGVARIEFRATPAGQQALVDGEPVEAEPGQSAQAAAVAQVSRMAADHGTGTPRVLRAVMVDEAHTGWPVTISENGSVRPDRSPAKSTDRRAQARHLRAGAKARLPLRSPLARLRAATVRLPAPGGAPSDRGLVVLIAALVVVIVAAVWAVGVLRGTSGTQLGTGTYPGTVAGEWAPSARWVTPPLLTEAGPLAVTDKRAAMVTAERKVVAVDPMSGKVAWSADLPDGDVKTPLTVTRIAGEQAVAAQVGHVLAWWSMSEGKPGSVELPENGDVTYLGDSPLVGVDASTVAVVDQGGHLARVPVPGGALALAARADGRVTAASAAGWWHLTPGQAAAAPQRLEVPDPAASSPTAKAVVLGYVGGSVITVWPADASGKQHVAVYKDDADSVWLSFRGPIHTVDPTRPSMQTWTPSPSKTWGLLSRTLVDVQHGRVQDLGPWTTRAVAVERASGAVAGKTAQVGPSVPRSALDPTTGIPEATAPAGAVVRVRSGEQERAYMLPPIQ